jgi:hypothetical protein
MKHAILGLLERGWSERRIARELGVNRRTVRRYARLAAAGQSAPNPTPGSSGPESLCEPFREIVLAKLEAGLTAQRIWQDHGPRHAAEVPERVLQRPEELVGRLLPDAQAVAAAREAEDCSENMRPAAPAARGHHRRALAEVHLALGAGLHLDPPERELALRAQAPAEALHRLVARLEAVLGCEVRFRFIDGDDYGLFLRLVVRDDHVDGSRLDPAQQEPARIGLVLWILLDDLAVLRDVPYLRLRDHTPGHPTERVDPEDQTPGCHHLSPGLHDLIHGTNGCYLSSFASANAEGPVRSELRGFGLRGTVYSACAPNGERRRPRPSLNGKTPSVGRR